ncbi:MAG: hypothetical protein ACFE9S_09540 [Candidatus Hermodarchaeota archaeon]
MFQFNSRDSNSQSWAYHNTIHFFSLFLFIGSVVIAIFINILANNSNSFIFEFFKSFNIIVNIGGLGFLVNESFFISKYSSYSVKSEIHENYGYFILRYILMPVAIGIITTYIFGLLAILFFNMIGLTDIPLKSTFIFTFFYLTELFFVFIFIYVRKDIFSEKALTQVISLFKSVRQKFSKVWHLMRINTTKFTYLIFLLVISLAILIISLILGEINYDFEMFNIILVYIFFILIVLQLILYFRLKNKSIFLDIIIIFILVFSLVHLYISRGPTLIGRTDIHKEFFHAQHTLRNINWNPNEFQDNYNTVISISIFPMILSLIFSIKLETFFELITPILFSLLNIAIFLLIKRLYRRYHHTLLLDKSSTQENFSFLIIFSVLLIIFIRSYTHLIAASSRIVLAYFLFTIFCLLLIYDHFYTTSRHLVVQLLLLISVLLSHWGTFLFGVAAIIISYILFFIHQNLGKQRVSIDYSKIIQKKFLKHYLLIGSFIIIVILWLFVFAQTVMIFIGERVLYSINNFFENEIDKFFSQIGSLLSSYRIFDFSNSFLFLETIINSIFILVILVSSFCKLIRIYKWEKILVLDFFGFSTLIIMVTMFIIPVLSSFYNPLRVGMQFWPFIAPIFFIKVNFSRINFIRFPRPQFFRKLVKVFRTDFILSIFLFFILIFHQGVVYDCFFSSGTLDTTEIIEIGDGMSLVFRNYGVEAWRWVLTESDIIAIEWLNSQAFKSIYADLSRTYMLFSRINGTPPEDERVSNSLTPLIEYYKTNISEHIRNLKDSYFFFSSQNLDSGFMFFTNKGYNTSRLILQLEEFGASLIYSNKTQIYYLPQ